MIKIVSQNSGCKNLILLIHGFIGGEKTWIQDGSMPFINQLLNDNVVKDNFDIGIFKYHSELLSFFPKIRALAGMIRRKKVAANLPIEEISRLLDSQLRYSYKHYDTIILIGHSMGGLVGKRLILNDIKQFDSTRIKLYISLATPHDGSTLAAYGKNIISNFQIKDLAPLSKTISDMNSEWVLCQSLPKRLYAQGSYDLVVPNTSSVSYDRETPEVVYSDDDHFSIIKPEGKNVIIDSIISELHQIIATQDIQSITVEERFVDTGQYDEEVFVLKMLMADIHSSLMSGAKQAFYNAEFTTRRLVAQGVSINELAPLYEKIKELYFIEFGEYITGVHKSSDELLNAVHKKILEKDKNYLQYLYEPLQGLQKFGMLHQLATSDTDVWWKKEHTIESLEAFKEKIKKFNA